MKEKRRKEKVKKATDYVGQLVLRQTYRKLASRITKRRSRCIPIDCRKGFWPDGFLVGQQGRSPTVYDHLTSRSIMPSANSSRITIRGISHVFLQTQRQVIVVTGIPFVYAFSCHSLLDA